MADAGPCSSVRRHREMASPEPVAGQYSRAVTAAQVGAASSSSSLTWGLCFGQQLWRPELPELAARPPRCEPHRPARLTPRPGQMVTWRRCRGLRRLGRAASVWWQTPSSCCRGAMWRRLPLSLRCRARASSSGFRGLGPGLLFPWEGREMAPPGAEPVLPQLLFLPLLGDTAPRWGGCTLFPSTPRGLPAAPEPRGADRT